LALIHQYLRRQTADDHAKVDSAYGFFDLGDRDAYARLLRAHASVTPVVEAMLATQPALPAWRARALLLLADLAVLGVARPAPVVLAPIVSFAGQLGALYVLEGSRLGGRVLAGRVCAALPATYLSDEHRPGEWRGFLGGLSDVSEGTDEQWRRELVDGARRVFRAYLESALSWRGPERRAG
jgi:heme oxygenase